MDKLLGSLDTLIKDGTRVATLAAKHASKRGNGLPRLQAKLLKSSDHVLRFAGMDEYADQLLGIRRFDSSVELSASDAARVLGVLESARDMLRAGYVGHLRYLLHGEMFDSVLEQATALLDAGHHVPAAVLGRIVVERWLRDEAQKVGVTNWATEKASKLNDSLKQKGVVSVHKWRATQSQLDLGNAAAHGKAETVIEADVRAMLEFAKVNCT
jgi:hypothetical protein